MATLGGSYGVRARWLIDMVSVASGSFPENFRTNWLLWNVHVHFDCAGSHKTRNLAQTSCQGTSYRELVERSCEETSSGDLVQRSCQETSCRDLANRALKDYRVLVERSCQETFDRDLVQGPGEESSDLAQRFFFKEMMYRDLARTPLTETLYRDIA